MLTNVHPVVAAGMERSVGITSPLVCSSLPGFQVLLMSRLPQDTRNFVVLTYCDNDVTHLGLQVLFTLQEFGNQQLRGRILHNDLMSDW